MEIKHIIIIIIIIMSDEFISQNRTVFPRMFHYNPISNYN